MTKDPTLGIQVHVTDETKIEASQVPSDQKDFVSVKFGWHVSVLLFNSAQAKTLADAAIEAYGLLMKIETDTKASELVSAWDSEDEYDDEEGYDCTIENPCSLCLNSH